MTSSPAQVRPATQGPTPPVLSQPAELARSLGLQAELADAEILRGFPFRVTRAFAERMRPEDPQDPLLRQVWPDPREADDVPGFVPDPLGELSRIAPGRLLRKYRGRALVVATAACAIHCRYCFRRHFPYPEPSRAREAWQDTLAALREDTSIEEVILSGGDPLTLSDERLAELAQGLAQIPHLRRLRIHSRMPVVSPERIGEGFLAWWERLPLQRILVLHVNHPNEIDDAVVAACGRLLASRTVLLNQSVLLAGINDTADVLVQLSEKLLAAGALPYYLHMLDPVQGAAHFQVEEAKAKALMRDIAARLPGYLVPRLVREVEGDPGKAWVAW